VKRFLLFFLFGFLIAFFVVPQFNYIFAEQCEDPDFGNCINPGNVCIPGDEGRCDDANNKNYVCMTYTGSAPRCTPRWECSCAAAGTSREMNCTSKAYNGGTSTAVFTCKKTTDVCIRNTNIIDTNKEVNSANEFLAGVKCAAASSPEAKKVAAKTNAGPEDFPLPPAPPCVDDITKTKICTKVKTAFGDVGTQPGAFITRLFGILLAASGAIATLLIMRAGYQIMTARGNPEGIKEGREKLVAAIVGLMFLIFSFVLLQVIGVDLLRLPNTGGGGSIGKGGTCDVNNPNCMNGLVCQYSGSQGQCVEP
jgi:hypothetical protein